MDKVFVLRRYEKWEGSSIIDIYRSEQDALAEQAVQEQTIATYEKEYVWFEVEEFPVK